MATTENSKRADSFALINQILSNYNGDEKNELKRKFTDFINENKELTEEQFNEKLVTTFKSKIDMCLLINKFKKYNLGVKREISMYNSLMWIRIFSIVCLLATLGYLIMLAKH